MLVGLNYPWAYNKYGLYFGTHMRPGDNMLPETWMDEFYYPHPSVRPSNGGVVTHERGPMVAEAPAHLAANLDRMKELWNVKVVRFFLLCNGQNLGRPDPSGLWKMAPYDSEYSKHLRTILELLRARGMKAILSILDFGIGSPPHRDEGRHFLITNPIMRDTFVRDIVIPLVRVGLDFRDAIYAWEAMNEPSWLTRMLWPHPQTACLPAASTAQVNDFLHAVLAGIKAADAATKTTVGHRYLADTTTFATGDIVQFHYYPKYVMKGGAVLPSTDPRYLPLARDLKPSTILGEIGASSSHGDSWSELDPADGPTARERVRERLRQAERKGYELVLLWPDETWTGPLSEDPLKFSHDAQLGLSDYVAGRR